MLHFNMDADNFGDYLGGGTCDSTRLTDEGVVLDYQRHDADADTLALWHLSADSWDDAGDNGYDLSPQNGASLTGDGAQLVAAQNQYASTTLGLQGRDEVTIELWFRLDSLPHSGQSIYGLFSQYWNCYGWLLMSAPGVYVLRSRVMEDNGSGSYVTQACDWTFPTGAEPELGRWYHMAMAWQRGVAMRMFLDGTMCAEATSLTGNGLWFSSSTFFVGRYPSGYSVDGCVDEVRVSEAVRYTTNFQPKRHVAAGAFDSPTFDAARVQAEWLALDAQATTPGSSQLSMHVRADDELDAQDHPNSEWEALGSNLPPGRYGQWRAVLVRSADATGLNSPTLQSVDATASEAGYNLYQGTGATAEAIDYETPVALLGPTALMCQSAGLSYPGVHWFGLRSADVDGREAPTVDAEVRLELDDAGVRVPPRPASVRSLEAEGAGGGRVRLTWLAVSEAGEAATDVFRVYCGDGEVSFDTPVGTVTCLPGRRNYQWQSDPSTDGQTVVFAVRAETDEGGQDADPPQVAITIDASSPAAVGQPAATTRLSD
ncbi:MAG: LamG domain-containing protein [Planctomycetes bacterium]|nr:LamG domain-containing protein [Planctomycetota bacterium]